MWSGNGKRSFFAFVFTPEILQEEIAVGLFSSIGAKVFSDHVFKMWFYRCHIYSRKSKIAFPVYTVTTVVCVSFGQHLWGWRGCRHFPSVPMGWVCPAGAWGPSVGFWQVPNTITLQPQPGWFLYDHNPVCSYSVCSYSAAVISVTSEWYPQPWLKEILLLQSGKPAFKLVSLERDVCIPLCKYQRL